MSLKRFSRPAGLSITVAAVALLLLGALSTIGARTRHRVVVEQVSGDLRQAQRNLRQAADSIDLQIKITRHLIAWIEQTEEEGSAEVVADLSAMRRHNWAPAPLSAVLGLAASGDLEQVSDAATRGRLLAMQRRLMEAQSIAEPGFEQFRELLEQTLTPGMWRFVFYGESGKYPIDYKAALHDLYVHGMQSSLRSLLRGLLDERAELTALSAEAADLLSAVSGARSSQADQP